MAVSMKGVIDLDSIVSRRADLVATDIDDDKVFLDIESGKYFGMNRVGGFIWEMTEQSVSVRAICAGLMERFDIDESTCRTETLHFCQALHDAGSLLLDAKN